MKKKSSIQIQNNNNHPELKKVEYILNNMKRTLSQSENLSRFTALKELQMEEDNDAFKILIGTILSARSRDETTSKIVSSFFRNIRMH